MVRILVADDDPNVRAAITKTLVAAGHTVEEAGEGQAALDLYARQPCDLVVMDLYMPGMDGLETIIRLKAQRPEVKIVAMSGGGYRNKHDVLTMALQAGVSGTLAKPFDLDDLRAAVSAALATPSPGPAAPTEPASRPKATVLLVDDDQRARSLLRNRLEGAGYAVVEAPDAEHAIEQFRAQPTEAVIADLILPRESGDFLIAWLRSEAPGTGIIAISGAPERLAAIENGGAGQARFRTLPKPFTTEQLLEALNAVLAPSQEPAAPRSWLGRVLKRLKGSA